MEAPTDALTRFLATWGALLATFGLGWNLYRDMLDRARLKLAVNIRRLVRSTDGKWYAVAPNLEVAEASERLFLVMDVTNIGRRPIQWTGWGAIRIKPVRGKKSFAVIPAFLPKMLNEGETHSEFTDGVEEIENIKRLFIWDGTGRNWNVSRRKLRKLKDEALKFQSEDSGPPRKDAA